MLSSHGNEQLQLLHEPEAAALYTLDMNKGEVNLGDTIMNVDAGGGTVDITVHEWKQRKGGKCGLSEECYREGVLAGSTFVDDVFEKYVKGKVRTSVWWRGGELGSS